MMSHDPVLQSKNCSFAIYVLIATATLLILLVDYLPVRVNMTASMPRGIYLLTRALTAHVGDFVMVCLDHSLAQFALQRRYLRAGDCANGTQPLLKQIAAQSGDEVKLEANAVIVNSNPLPHSATFAMDSFNRALPAIRRGVYILKINQLWLYGTESAKSWDSRYFGAIDHSHIVQVVKPLFVWSGRKNA